MASFNEISDLKPFKTMWKIRVKIIRLWTQYSPASGVTIEMVLIDSKGNKIHASVKKELVKQFEPFLQQDASKIIINFSVSHSCGSYKTTNHPYKIMFLSTTRVRNCEELSTELNGFNPVNYHDIFDDTLDQDFLIDVIGQIVNINSLEEVAVKGNDTTKLTLELRNSSDVRLPIVLWGNIAKDVNKAIQDCDHDPIICVLRFGKIKEWKGNYSVSNAYNVSYVLINPSLPEVEAFMSLMPKDNPPLMIMDSNQSSLIKYESHKDDFFVQTPSKTIKEVLESKQVEKCIVMARISGFDNDMGWYYLSCKTCAKKVLQVPVDYIDDEDDNVIIQYNYYCEKCKTDKPIILPRYKLHLNVTDNTSQTKFLLFDNLAMQLLNHPASKYVNLSDHEETNIISSPLMDLVGKTILFKIGIEREHYAYKHNTYKVLKIITKTEIITDFTLKKGSPTHEIKDNAYSQESLVLMSESGDSSGYSTPSKRKEHPLSNQTEEHDQNSVTRTSTLIRIKKEKIDKSG